MKRFSIICCLVVSLLVCFACATNSTNQPEMQAAANATPPTASSTPEPTQTPTPEPTPEPTPTPRVLAFSPNVEISKTEPVSMIVDSVSYTQNQSIDIDLTITNSSEVTWAFDSFYGSINGWGFSFSESDEYITVDPANTQSITITATLTPTLDDLLKMNDLQNLYLTSSGWSYEGKSAYFTCQLVDNADCSPDYVQEYPSFDTSVYESKLMKISLVSIDWESHTAYLYVENMGKKGVFLKNLCPAVNGYSSEEFVVNAYLPGDYGKTILMFDLSSLAEEYKMDQLKKLAFSGDWSDKIDIGYSREYTFEVPVEGGDDAYLPTYDETGEIWIDDNNVKLIYRGVTTSLYGSYELELLLINKTADKPLFIPPQQGLTFGEDRPWIYSNVIVAPGAASIVHLEVYSESGMPVSPENVGIRGSIVVGSTGFRNIASGKIDISPKS